MWYEFSLIFNKKKPFYSHQHIILQDIERLKQPQKRKKVINFLDFDPHESLEVDEDDMKL